MASAAAFQRFYLLALPLVLRNEGSLRQAEIMAMVEITDIGIAPLAKALLGRSLDVPKVGNRLDAAAVDLQGWVVANENRVHSVEVWADGEVVQRLAVATSRPDVHRHFGELQGTERPGFAGVVSLGDRPAKQLTLRAVLSGGGTAEIATLTLRSIWRSPADDADRGLVTVVIPCYNHAHFLRDAIESAIAQTYRQIDIVVVDDGSTDNTEEVARSYGAVRFVRQENRGLAEARNTGLRCSTGEFVAFVDADDRLCPEGLAAGVRVLDENPEVVLAGGEYRDIDIDGRVFREWLPKPRGDDPYAELLRGYHIAPPACFLYRRAIFDDVGTFDRMKNPSEDYDMYLRIARRFPVRFHPAVVAEYRRYGTSMSGDSARMLLAVLRIIRQQSRWIGTRPEWRAAAEEGRQFFRDYYGKLMIDELQLKPFTRFQTALRLLPADPQTSLRLALASLT